MNELQSQLQAILFLSNQPFTVRKLAKLVAQPEADVATALEALAVTLQEMRAGVLLARVEDAWQMVTNPQHAALAKMMVKEEIEGELTRPSVETLAVVAYRGPLTKMEIEQIRGVNCSLILRNLQMRGLVEELPAADELTLPRYVVSHDFLRWLGVTRLEELPEFQHFRELDLSALAQQNE